MDDGGSAFPSPGIVFPQGTQQGAYEGMSLRDWFAGQALAGAMAAGGYGSAEKTSSMAYQAADAMLNERKK